jgi:hypothetical protein
MDETMAQSGWQTHRGVAGLACPTEPGFVICAPLCLALVKTSKEGTWRAQSLL